ncbi:MAG: PAS domain S-box protein, partial [Patescibacteria group bacterium]
IAKDTVELIFDLAHQAFSFSPGQYKRLTIPGLKGDVRGSSRDFSIVSSPSEKNKITVAFRVSNGVFKQALLRVEMGTELTLRGPLGVFTLPADASTPIVFIAGGIGITPFISMVRFATENKLPYKMRLIYANSDNARAAYVEELRALARQNTNFTLVEKIGPVDKDFILQSAPDSPETLWYVCGQPEMVTQTRQTLAGEVGVEPERIRFEDYVGYGDSTKPYKVFGPFPKKNLQLDENLSNTLLQAIGITAIVSMDDIEGNIIYANAMFEQVSKYSKEELLGQNHRILKSGYHNQAFYEELWKTISSGKVWRGEIKNKAKDGTFYWVDTVIAPIFGEDGKPYQYIAVRFPITEKKSLEEQLEVKAAQLNEQLQKSQARNKSLDDAQKAMLNVLEDTQELQKELGKFKLAADSAYEHIIITDNKGVILYANKGAQRNTGYTLEEMIGKTTALWGGQMNEDYYQQMWQTLTVKKAPFIGDITNKRKNGESYIAQLNISPILDTNGSISFFVGLENDITKERKLAEALRQEKAGVEKKVIERTQQLGEEQTRLQASINSLNSGFILTDKAQNILVINHVAQELLCITHELHRSGSGDFQCTIQTIAAGLKDFDLPGNINRSIRGSVKIKVRDIKLGEAFLRIDISPIVMKQGERLEVIGAVVFVEDITEAKLVERSRDEFFSIASHELRTPLTAIRGNTSLIQQYYADELKDSNLREMIEDIHESSVRLIEIVNDFLDSSRLEQNRITFQNEPFDPVKLADDVIRGYQVTSSRKMLYIHLEPPQQPIAPVLADKNRVKQVLINLVGNGLKFTDQGGVTIRLEPQAGFVKISVQDTGHGIAPENQKLLFRKFQQAASSLITRDTTQGTGLGLYISKLIIEGMGGQIHLESSKVNEGSIFSFTLPLAGTKTPPPQTPPPQAPLAPGAAGVVKL